MSSKEMQSSIGDTALVDSQPPQHPLMMSKPKNTLSNEEEEEIMKEVVKHMITQFKIYSQTMRLEQ